MVSTMWIKVYNQDNVQISLTLEIDSPADVQARLSEIAAAGLSLKEKDDSEKSENIHAVIRRKSKNGHTVIDLYPEWREFNKGVYGEYKFAHVYLGTADEIAEFEAQSGLKLAELPIYTGQGAFVRTQGETSEWERSVRRTFSMSKTLTGHDKEGKPEYKYAYTTPLSPATTNGNGSATTGYTHWSVDPENVMTVTKGAIQRNLVPAGTTPADIVAIIGAWTNYPDSKAVFAALAAKPITTDIPF